MTPREVYGQMANVDRRLDVLTPLRAERLALRQQFVLLDSHEARENVAMIERGIRSDEGCPVALVSLQGKPGLTSIEHEIARLRERRTLLAEHVPAQSQREAAVREATDRAAKICADADGLDERAARVSEMTVDFAHRALALTEELWQLHLDNEALDRLCHDEAIQRPSTPRYDAVKIPVAPALGVLLGAHFNGGRANDVSRDLVYAIRSAPREQQTAF